MPMPTFPSSRRASCRSSITRQVLICPATAELSMSRKITRPLRCFAAQVHGDISHSVSPSAFLEDFAGDVFGWSKSACNGDATRQWLSSSQCRSCTNLIIVFKSRALQTVSNGDTGCDSYRSEKRQDCWTEPWVRCDAGTVRGDSRHTHAPWAAIGDTWTIASAPCPAARRRP
jgi:hypothetical protein